MKSRMFVLAATVMTATAGCGGSNDSSTPPDTSPKNPVTFTPYFASVSAGGQHTCAMAVRSTGLSVYCWGANEHGQLGDGTTVSRTTPQAVVGLTVPSGFTRVVTGGQSSCLSSGGSNKNYCWGDNSYGQLGDGTVVSRLTPGPELVLSADIYSTTFISLGARHACASGEDRPSCWGDGRAGQLGDGTPAGRLTPTELPGKDFISDVSAGGSHSCGWRGDDELMCWGDNSTGQLGDGTTTARLSPVLTSIPARVKLLHVRAGERHTCALDRGGVAYCWGENTYGQLGDGTTTNRSAPVAVAGGLSFTELAPGSSHTCGRTNSGAIFCWGANAEGQLGNGTTTDSSVPVNLAGGFNFVQVIAGSHHSCGLTRTGAAYCWGSNREGQLGDGTTAYRNTPTRVPDPA